MWPVYLLPVARAAGISFELKGFALVLASVKRTASRAPSAKPESQNRRMAKCFWILDISR